MIPIKFFKNCCAWDDIMVDITVVNWTFDSESDSLVLFRKDAHDHDFSVKLDKDAIAYFDSEKLPCMFEFFNISKVFRTDQIHHDDIEKIRFNISITRKYVEVRMELNVVVDYVLRRRKLEFQTFNNSAIPMYYKDFVFVFNDKMVI